MTDSSPAVSNSAIVRIVIVDDDPIFRVGLRTWLKQYAEFQVVEDISDRALVRRRLQARFAPSLTESETSPSPPSAASGSEGKVLILGGPMYASPSVQEDLVTLCQGIKVDYPTLAVLVIGTDVPGAIAAAQRAGANGYVSKAQPPEQILVTLRQVVAGQFSWSTVLPSDGSANDVNESVNRCIGSFAGPTPATAPAAGVGVFAQFRFRLRVSGVQQIDRQLNQLLSYQEAITTQAYPPSDVSVLDQWVVAGRCRELRVARWMVNQLLATPALEYLDWEGQYRPSAAVETSDLSTASATEVTPSATANPPLSPPPTEFPEGMPRSGKEALLVRWQRRLGAIAQQPLYQATSGQLSRSQSNRAQSNRTQSNRIQTNRPQTGRAQRNRDQLAATSAPSSPLPTQETLSPVSIRSTLFDSLHNRLQCPLVNQTEHPLELDILREEKKRELLVLVLHKILGLLDDLRYSEVQPQQLVERRSQLFYDLWQAILTDYFGKYYVVQVDGLELEVITILSQDARVVQESIFNRIPFVTDLLAHFLFQFPLEIDSVPYGLGTPEAFERAELLLDNVVLQMGNSVIQPLLNHLADVELIKQNFYDRKLMSSRDIAQFRNSLSWHYRRQQLINEPTAIFESSYPLLTLQGEGIKETSIYASRRAELDRLSGIPLVVTLVLELRDALAPRVRGAIAAVGSGVIYLLTEVIGRGIGLIGRGILKGIGAAWQDPRSGS